MMPKESLVVPGKLDPNLVNEFESDKKKLEEEIK